MDRELSLKISERIDELSRQTTFARMMYGTYLQLSEIRRSLADEQGMKSPFWRLVQGALFESALIRLCRIYDRGSSSCGLSSLLRSMEQNLDIFDEECFRVRFAGNPNQDELVNQIGRPERKQIKDDLEFLNKSELIGNLKHLRDKFIAHLDKNFTEKARFFDAQVEPKHEDFIFLLDRASEIIGRYFKHLNGFDLTWDSRLSFPISGVFAHLLNEKDIDHEKADL